jgi:hypothetical protein
MGMFDDIIVPKSYLKSLLTKEQEKLVKDNNYQTKSLENFLAEYKVHRQKLYIKEGFKKGGKWVILKNYTGEVNFYTSFLDKDENTWWTEFNFSFVDGVLDKKELIKFELQETAEEAKEREKIWKKRQAEIDAFQKTFKYKFFDKIRIFLSRILEWVQQQTRMPSPNSVKIDRQRVSKKRKKLSFWKDY